MSAFKHIEEEEEIELRRRKAKSEKADGDEDEDGEETSEKSIRASCDSTNQPSGAKKLPAQELKEHKEETGAEEEDSIMSKLKLTQRKRSLLENQVVMNWLRNLSRNKEKEKILHDRYYKRTAEI